MPTPATPVHLGNATRAPGSAARARIRGAAATPRESRELRHREAARRLRRG